jgi:SNF2 family DNA or RNA helicase
MINNVVNECRLWSPQRNPVVIGGQTKETRRFLLDIMVQTDQYFCVVNYEAWRKDNSLLKDLTDIGKFDTIIIDEAHNVKDRKSNAYRGVKRLIDDGNIPFVFPMTGTPILNRPQELFSLLTLVDPFHFTKESYFLSQYCMQDMYTKKWTFRPGGMESLARKITPQFLRRTKEQAGIKLPPKTVQVHEIPVDFEAYPRQADVRRQMQNYASIMLEPETGKAIQAAAIIAMYTRLRQIETWPDGIRITDPKTHEVVMQVECGESQKLDYIIHPNGPSNSYADADGLLLEVVSDERVVIFSQFKEPLRELYRRCTESGIRAVVLDGDTPSDKRTEIAYDFDARSTTNGEHKWDVVLCNYKVGGVGLNFTNASQMIVVDEEWNPGKRDQAYDRIHRMGQEKPVTIHVLRDKLPSGGGIDKWLADLIEVKEDMVTGFANASDLAAQGYAALRAGMI